jgi:hypothetical protein
MLSNAVNKRGAAVTVEDSNALRRQVLWLAVLAWLVWAAWRPARVEHRDIVRSKP